MRAIQEDISMVRLELGTLCMSTLEGLQRPVDSRPSLKTDLAQIRQEVAVALGPRRSQATYADIVAGPRQTLPQPRPTIIISSKDEKYTNEDVLTRIRKVADAKKSGLTVETVRKARNQKVVISCESESALTRLTEKLTPALHIVRAEVSANITVVQAATLQRKKLATHELLKEATSRCIDVSIDQEPYVGAEGVLKQSLGMRVIQKTQNRYKPVKAAIIIHNQNMEIHEDLILTTENIAKVKCNNIILAGDVNAWSTWWESIEENHRGAELSSFLDELELQVLNVGEEPTFEVIRNSKVYASRVDIITCTQDLLGKINEWEVNKEYTSSDHNAITFNINLEKQIQENNNKTTRKYNTKKTNWEKFKNEFNIEIGKTA
ncbi:jg7110 [Pararge aegeria aegeria]|uniref:Jg7110 protein n=1 Tax=Pararge aegeria aegeria TaxID=348720 RepID=A0A8S4QJ99_9NEOP|nr:jg7110 [Pararge aegeria aegeria]